MTDTELQFTGQPEEEVIFRLIADQLPDLIFALKQDGEIFSVQGKINEVLGYSKEELRGQNFYNLCETTTGLGTDGAVSYSALKQFSEEKNEEHTFKDVHLTLRTRYGEIRNLECNGNKVYDQNGKLHFICIVGRDITLRKRMQDRIDYLRQLNEKILNSLHEGMLVLEVPDLRILNINRSLLSAIRLQEYQVIGSTCDEIFRNFGRPKLFADMGRFIQRTLTISKVSHHECLVHDLGPTPLYLELVIHPIGIAESKTRQLLVLVRDITPRKRFEIDLKRRVQKNYTLNNVSEAFQATMHQLDNLLYCLLVGVTAGKGLGFNRAFVLLVNESENMLKGQLAVGPGNGEEAAAIWSNLDQMQLSLPELLKAGPRNPNENMQVMRIVRSIAIPLQDRENLLVRSLETKKVFNVCNGKVQGEEGILVNAELMSLLQTNSFVCIPLYTPQKQIGVILVDNFLTRRPVLFEDLEFLKNLTNQASYAIDNARLYEELEQKIQALEQANVQLVEQQQTLLEAERLGTIGKMAATVAHEIRNPLVTIGGYARMLLSDPTGNPSSLDDLRVIAEEVSRLELLVNELLDYARYAKPSMECHDLNQLVSELVQRFGKDSRFTPHQLTTQFQPDLLMVYIDENQIKQVLINLLLNAAQAITESGCIHIQTSSHNGQAMVSVTDNGCGIPEDLKEKVFTPFFTTKSSGTGLGLNIASQIISAHSGEISFESTEGVGTTFKILLPFCCN